MLDKKAEGKKQKNVFLNIWKSRYLYLMILPFMAWLFTFCYAPMYGVVLAFKQYKTSLGILGSPWVGLQNFERIFVTPQAYKAIVNTIEISLARLIFEFPIPIIVAIMINEIRGSKLKRVSQTVLTFPHFLSWIVVATLMKNFFANAGAVNVFLRSLGLESVEFLGSKALIRPILYITSNWKGMGWSAIIYMAAIAGIDPSLYEAAYIDGANRWQQIWHITLSGLKATIVIMFILAVGNILNAGFDQIYYMSNSVVKDEVRILDTYIFDMAMGSAKNYGFTTAVGLFKSVVNFIFLALANTIVGKLTGQKMFY